MHQQTDANSGDQDQTRREFKALCVDKLLDYTAIQCMRVHANSAIVQTQALRLLAALAYGNDLVRRRAGEEGVMRQLTAAMVSK